MDDSVIERVYLLASSRSSCSLFVKVFFFLENNAVVVTGDRLLTNGFFVGKEVWTRLLLLVNSMTFSNAKSNEFSDAQRGFNRGVAF